MSWGELIQARRGRHSCIAHRPRRVRGLYSDTADWAAPRGRHSDWVGGWPTYFRDLVAGTCTLGGLAILGRSFRRASVS